MSMSPAKGMDVLMIRIRDLSVAPGEEIEKLRALASKELGVPERELTRLKIVRKSVDARRKSNVRVIYTVDVSVDGDAQTLIRRAKNARVSAAEHYRYVPPEPERIPEMRPVVAGFGPAGMFAALVLAQAGLRPLILERGADVDARTERVRRFWATGELDTDSNVQFGEGGAGTFSDGKLTTGTKNERIGWVLEQLHMAGAHEDILYDAKPHIGTDVLATVVRNIRERILSLGGEIRFYTKLNGLSVTDGRLTAVQAGEEAIACARLVLATGHSARDTFELLHELGVPMSPKPFSMGVRIEHLQKNIDHAQYGSFAGAAGLPPADYKLACHMPDGSSAYTFCMCPGGYVTAAASERGGVVTNGMSFYARGGENANSALLVSLSPEDFPYDGPLGGMYWQREIERACFAAAGGGYRAPAQLVGDFLAGRESEGFGRVLPTYKPGVALCDLRGVLPEKLTAALERALAQLEKKLTGFADPDAVMTAPETRSSSPVRILRGADMQSALRGVYPCGEGAGYAGGIVSAAVDGMLCAEAIINSCGQSPPGVCLK